MSHQIVFTFWLIWLFFFFPFLCICLPAYIDCCCVVVFVVVFLFWFVIFNCFSWEGSVRLCCYPFREKCGNEDTVHAICGPILSPGMGYCGLLMVRQGCKRKKEEGRGGADMSAGSKRSLYFWDGGWGNVSLWDWGAEVVAVIKTLCSSGAGRAL